MNTWHLLTASSSVSVVLDLDFGCAEYFPISSQRILA